MFNLILQFSKYKKCEKSWEKIVSEFNELSESNLNESLKEELLLAYIRKYGLEISSEIKEESR